MPTSLCAAKSTDPLPSTAAVSLMTSLPAAMPTSVERATLGSNNTSNVAMEVLRLCIGSSQNLRSLVPAAVVRQEEVTSRSVDRDFQARWCAATSRRGGMELASVPGGHAEPTRLEVAFHQRAY